MENTMTQTTPTETEVATEADLLARWSLIVALLALAIATLDIAATLIIWYVAIPIPPWGPLAQRVGAEIGVLLGDASIVFNLLSAWRILIRSSAFDPHEARRDLVLDDLTQLLGRA